MKYMGSKRGMLLNGLGEIIESSVHSAAGFADIFTGSGAVACHVSERYNVPVHAFDLQSFAVALADGVIGRTEAACDFDVFAEWIERGCGVAQRSKIWRDASALEGRLELVDLEERVNDARIISANSESDFCRAYGGYYFSPTQATVLSSLREELPVEANSRKLALAALISTASKCAASPGHTAQPFRPTMTAGPYLVEAWSKSIPLALRGACEQLLNRKALKKGLAKVAEATEAVKNLDEGWIAFLDPPYSSVHYSRFYHVLESLSRGYVGEVSGNGRYPSVDQRPSSDFSIPSKAEKAFEKLLGALSDVGAQAIVTFPAHNASNGISGDMLRDIASVNHKIVEEKVSSRFSTMGGNRSHRQARQDAVELILHLIPR